MSTIHVDFRTDPLTWPWDSDTPDEYWLVEYAATAAYMQESPDHWLAKRFPLASLKRDPDLKFKRRFITMWAYATLPHEESLPKASNLYLLQRLDELLVAERMAQIRGRLTQDALPARLQPPTVYAKRKIDSWPAVKAAWLERDPDARINVTSAAQELGVDRDTLSRWITDYGFVI